MTSYQKEMIQKGYSQVKIADLLPGDVVYTQAEGDTIDHGTFRESIICDRVVAEVFQATKSGKRIRFVDNKSVKYGNSAKIWKKN